MKIGMWQILLQFDLLRYKDDTLMKILCSKRNDETAIEQSTSFQGHHLNDTFTGSFFLINYIPTSKMVKWIPLILYSSSDHFYQEIIYQTAKWWNEDHCIDSLKRNHTGSYIWAHSTSQILYSNSELSVKSCYF